MEFSNVPTQCWCSRPWSARAFNLTCFNPLVLLRRVHGAETLCLIFSFVISLFLRLRATLSPSYCYPVLIHELKKEIFLRFLSNVLFTILLSYINNQLHTAHMLRNRVDVLQVFSFQWYSFLWFYFVHLKHHLYCFLFSYIVPVVIFASGDVRLPLQHKDDVAQHTACKQRTVIQTKFGWIPVLWNVVVVLCCCLYQADYLGGGIYRVSFHDRPYFGIKFHRFKVTVFLRYSIMKTTVLSL